MNDTNKLEKIEISKNNGNFYYTGTVESPDKDGFVTIKTVRGEVLKFRKEQIMQRRRIDTKLEDDTNGKISQNNKYSG